MEILNINGTRYLILLGVKKIIRKHLTLYELEQHCNRDIIVFMNLDFRF